MKYFRNFVEIRQFFNKLNNAFIEESSNNFLIYNKDIFIEDINMINYINDINIR